MVHAAVIPNREVVGTLPAVPHLQVVVVDDEAQEPRQQAVGLARREAVNVLDVVAQCEHGLPACYGVGADLVRELVRVCCFGLGAMVVF